MAKQRNSNIEILRIFSMLLIVIGHCLGTRFEGTNQQLNVFLTNTVFGSWAILGVDLFVIISAWFLCEQSFKTIRVISVLFEAICYIFAFSIVYAVMVGMESESIVIAFKSTMLFYLDGIFKQHHWFVIAYIMMCFAAPVLNKLINCITKEALKLFLIVATLAFIYHNFIGAGYYSVIADSADFLYIYLLVGYFKKYGITIKRSFLNTFVIVVVVIVSRISLRFISDDGLLHYVYKLIDASFANVYRYSPILVLLAVNIFAFVIKKKPRSNRAINTIASASFGVYLFHETYIPLTYSFVSPATSEMVVRSQVSLKDLVVGWFCENGFINTDLFFTVEILAVALLIFICGTLFEFLCNALIHKPVMKVISNKWRKALERLDSKIDV